VQLQPRKTLLPPLRKLIAPRKHIQAVVRKLINLPLQLPTFLTRIRTTLVILGRMVKLARGNLRAAKLLPMQIMITVVVVTIEADVGEVAGAMAVLEAAAEADVDTLVAAEVETGAATEADVVGREAGKDSIEATDSRIEVANTGASVEANIDRIEIIENTDKIEITEARDKIEIIEITGESAEIDRESIEATDLPEEIEGMVAAVVDGEATPLVVAGADLEAADTESNKSIRFVGTILLK